MMITTPEETTKNQLLEITGLLRREISQLTRFWVFFSFLILRSWFFPVLTKNVKAPFLVCRNIRPDETEA